MSDWDCLAMDECDRLNLAAKSALEGIWADIEAIRKEQADRLNELAFTIFLNTERLERTTSEAAARECLDEIDSALARMPGKADDIRARLDTLRPKIERARDAIRPDGGAARRRQREAAP